MKAKDWIAKFEALKETPDRFVEVLNEFGVETAELVAMRTKTSKPESRLPAADGAIREQKSKFHAICGQVLTLTESMFDSLLATAVPEYAIWQKAAIPKKIEKPEDDVKNYRQRRR